MYCILCISCLHQDPLSPCSFEACAEVLAFLCFICRCFEREPRFYSCIIVVSYFKFIWLWKNELKWFEEKDFFTSLLLSFLLSLGLYVLLHTVISIILVSLRSSKYFFQRNKGWGKKNIKKTNIWYCACCQYALHLNYSLNIQVGKYNKEMSIRNLIISCFFVQ